MLKVVVVEDAALVRKGLIMTTSWEQNQCEVVGSAANGIEGEKLILEKRPNIVITDIRLPGKSGLEMIEAVKNKVNAKFIIISGYSEFEYAKKALSLNVTDYLVKPVDDRALSDALARAGNAVWADSLVERVQMGQESIESSPIMLFREYLLYGTTTKSEYADGVIDYIRKNYASDISVKEIADSLSLSESHLSRIFKEETSYTIIDYLTYYRIRQACRLLSDPSIKIYEIANQIGYHDQRYFSAVFKRLVGLTPKEFRDSGGAGR